MTRDRTWPVRVVPARAAAKLLRTTLAAAVAVLLGGAPAPATAKLLGSTPAPDVVVVSASGPVTVGRGTAWRTAAPGTTVAIEELVKVPAGARCTLRVTGGAETTIAGAQVLAARRLAAGAAGVFLSDPFQQARSTVIEVTEGGSTALAMRGSQVPTLEEASRLGGRLRRVSFLGEEAATRARRSTTADFAESRLRAGDAREAIDYAWEILAQPDAPPLERRRAYLVLGQVLASDGELDEALDALDRASAPVREADPRARLFRTTALAQRGQVHLLLGNDSRAGGDFREAIDSLPGSAPAAQATFFLGTIALGERDLAAAKTYFERLKGFPELATAAENLLASAGP